MGLKRDAIGNTLGVHIENLGNILGIHWELESNILEKKGKMKKIRPRPTPPTQNLKEKKNQGTLSAC
jgi:hypothetical protein